MLTENKINWRRGRGGNMLNIKKRLLVLGATLLSFSFGLYGGQPGAFLNYGASARSIGMGSAFVAVANDSSAVYANPAGMLQLSNIEGSFFQSDLFGEYQLTAFNVVVPMVDNHIGFSYVQLQSNPMELRDAYNVAQGTFTDSKTSIGLSYAQPLFLPNLSIGTSVKYVTRKLYDNTDSRILGDVGAMFRPLPFLTIAGTVQNILDYQLDKNSVDKFKPVLRAGVAFRDRGLCLSYDLENDLNTWFLGAEYKVHPLLTVRGGLNYESTNFGFSSEVSGVRFDYAYSNSELGANNRFSINLGIGQIINDLQQDVASDWHATGIEKYREGFFLLALEDMKKAYILNPNDEDVVKKLTKLRKLEQLSDKLGLNLDTEKAIWGDYTRIKAMVVRGETEKAAAEIKPLLTKYNDNPNVLHLMDLINHPEKAKENNKTGGQS